MVRAYLLIQTLPGLAVQVAGRIGQMPAGVVADTVTGPYDVIAVLQAPTLDDLGRVVLDEVQHISGVTRTLTCPIVGEA